MKTKAGLTIFDRARCGLRPPKDDLASAGELREASVHHGGVVGGPRFRFEHASATWRSFQEFHQDVRGWLDIGYNLGVDGLGRLYAGRPIGKLPAAVLEHNSNSVGIVFMQDGDRHRLNWRQRRTLRILFEHGIPELGLPPLKRLEVKGHKEYAGHETNACPGHRILRQLRRRRRRSR